MKTMLALRTGFFRDFNSNHDIFKSVQNSVVTALQLNREEILF